MTVEEFATNHRLKTRIDCDGTRIVPGRRGHIYEYDPDAGLLGVCLMFQPGMSGSRAYGFAKRRLEASGLTRTQDGDFEGCFAFDPVQNPSGAKQAIREAKIRPRRVPTVATVERLRRIGFQASMPEGTV